MNSENESKTQKQKFVFNCTKCGTCCADRGPIPLVMSDLIRWAKNKVVANMMPYLKFIKTPQGTVDLVLGRKDLDPYAFLKKDQKDKKKEKDEARSCPFYNKEKKECLIYSNRPLSCRTYPLEYDGKKFLVVNTDTCPGIGNGEMTKEAKLEMRDLAKQMNKELTEMRIAMPILSQAFQPFIIQELMEAQQKFMKELEKMPPEERERIEKEMMKQQMK
ncbi:MAG: YkgJ family cysteine cluster protein [Promethearchaeota archaeon]